MKSRTADSGTQRVEEELLRLFPDVKLLRMDLDTTTSRGSHDKILRKFSEGEADILLGTQMVAKGLDFARVTLCRRYLCRYANASAGFRSAGENISITHAGCRPRGTKHVTGGSCHPNVSIATLRAAACHRS